MLCYISLYENVISHEAGDWSGRDMPRSSWSYCSGVCRRGWWRSHGPNVALLPERAAGRCLDRQLCRHPQVPHALNVEAGPGRDAGAWGWIMEPKLQGCRRRRTKPREYFLGMGSGSLKQASLQKKFPKKIKYNQLDGWSLSSGKWWRFGLQLTKPV